MEKKKSLTPEQLADAQQLKALYESKKKSLNVTQQQIADLLDITQGAVGHYLNGRNALNVSVASAFANKLGVSIAEFSPTLAKEASSYASASDANVSFVRDYKKGDKYPVISWVSAGAWAEAVEPYTMEEISEWYESDAHVEGNAFWLRVKGDSMTSPVGMSIPEGMLVLVDTGREAKNGSLVIAKLTDANEATFKKLVIDEGMGQRYLQPLNPNQTRFQIDGNCKIIGVAIETMMRLI
ncbi:S24 family peptidase [Erwinia sp. JH02]|uniref:LexA family protein n=1 Tax=Erwinia sp. JH02 TaxID=2733394 RepID=UPI00148880ED|nr:S24 family peptidase [Erwinia sp. JH02]NNS07302.1 helix-turn-helix domain-containing protein [Erwinia sp. JH02]